jgi:hypothetical protein
MLNEDQAKIDQATALIAELCPPHWRRLYQNCMREGFSENQAFELVKTYILGTNTRGINP